MRTCLSFLISLGMLLPAVSRASDPALLSRLDYIWGGGPHDIAIADHYAYLALPSSGMRVVDISVPSRPVDVGGIDDEAVHYMCASEDLLVTANRDVLHVYDLSDPALPELSATLDPGWDFPAFAMYGRLLAVSERGGSENLPRDLVLYDLTLPDEPVELVRHEGLLPGYISAMELVEDQLLVSAISPALYSVDLSDLETPIVSTPFENVDNYSEDVELLGNYAVLAAGGAGLQIVDLSTMSLVAEMPQYDYCVQVHLVGDMCYLAYGDPDCPLAIVDLADPANPVAHAEYAPPTDMIHYQIHEGHAYCADYSYGLRVVDLQNPDHPEEVGVLNHSGYVADLALLDEYLLVSEYFGVRTLDISDLEHPRLGSYLEMHPCNSSLVLGDRALLCCDGSTPLRMLDLSNPEQLAWLEADIEWNQVFPPTDLSVWGELVVATFENGFSLLDVSSPTGVDVVYDHLEEGSYNYNTASWNEYLIGCASYAGPLRVYRREEQGVESILEYPYYYGDVIGVIGDYFYRRQGLAMRVADLNSLPGELQFEPLDLELDQQGLRALGGDNSLLFLCAQNSPDAWVSIYDNSDPYHPELLARTDLPDYTESMLHSEDLLFVGDGHGISIFDVSQVNVAVETPGRTPAGFELLACAPNPFNPSTTLRFRCPQASHVEVAVYDLMGQRVTELANREFSAGEHELNWNGRDTRGLPAASGTYFMMARFPDGARVLPVSLLK